MAKRILELHVDELDAKLGDRDAAALVNSSSGGPALSMIETIPAGPNLISRDCSRFQYCPATSGGTAAAVAFGAVATKPISEAGLGKAVQPADSIRAIKGAVRVTTHKRESTISRASIVLGVTGMLDRSTVRSSRGNSLWATSQR